MRTIFSRDALGKVSPFGGVAGIPIYTMSREDVDLDRGAVLKRLPVPPGHTVSYPYIVKVNGVGEYIVQADGTASFYSYKYGGWEPPQAIDNASWWAKINPASDGRASAVWP